MKKATEHLWRRLDAYRGSTSMSDVLSEIVGADSDAEITTDLLYAILRGLGSRFIGPYLPPPELVGFVVELVASRSPGAVLDPTCGLGLMLKGIVDRVEAATVHGVEINSSAARVAERLLGDKATIFLGDSLRGGLPLAPAYDLIVGKPPFGMRLPKPIPIEGLDTDLKSEFADVLACWACTKLSPGGAAVLVLPSSFAWSQRSLATRAAVKSLGCRVSACIQIPGWSMKGTGPEAYLVVIERGEQEDVFIGQLTADAEHQRVLLDNLKARREGKRPAQGRLCNWESFRGYRAIDAADRVKRLTTRLGFNPVPMREMVLEATKTNKANFKRLEPKPNSVYLACTGRGKAAASQDELSAKLKDYVQLQINPKRADAHFVAELLSRELGQTILDSIRTGATIERFTVRDLMSVDFYLPPLALQAKVMASLDRIGAIRGEIDELETALWTDTRDVDSLAEQVKTVNVEDRFEDWIETLPFPLASILWRHKALTGSVRERYESLLHFFEALAEFVATVFLSAFSSDAELWADHRPRLQEALGKQHLTLERATVGTWKCVVEYLGSQCRRLLNESPDRCDDLFRTHNRDLLRMLTDPKLRQILQTANGIRNVWSGHVGAVGDREAKAVHSKLLALVQSCRSLFGRSWREYELIQPGKATFRDGVFHYKVRRMVGTRSMPFETVERESIEGLEDRLLYLLDPNSDRGLRLLPFVRVMPSPRTEANACYFYNRKQGEQIRYISYHYDKESDLTESFEDTVEALEELGLNAKGGDADDA